MLHLLAREVTLRSHEVSSWSLCFSGFKVPPWFLFGWLDLRNLSIYVLCWYIYTDIWYMYINMLHCMYIILIQWAFVGVGLDPSSSKLEALTRFGCSPRQVWLISWVYFLLSRGIDSWLGWSSLSQQRKLQRCEHRYVGSDRMACHRTINKP